MKGGKTRDLTSDERILWNLVARSARPLKGKAHPVDDSPKPPEIKPEAPTKPSSTARPGAAAPPAPARSQIHHLDRTTQQKLSRGKLTLEARIDLHGLRQDEAYGFLLSFLQRAHLSGVRYVLVITGKGSSSASDGVLKRGVPSWFATPAFRGLVSGYEDASRNHGGAGALYVRLRRLPASAP
ncbi:MAG: Smr/MutS family protein [Mesorhizobium sp.]|nr:Smr/MutS family protein [Mesorhizobium sp.]